MAEQGRTTAVDGEADRATPTLAARGPLDGYRHEGEGVTLHAGAPGAIVSLALAADDADARAAVERTLGVALPALGDSARCAFAGGATLLGLQPEQWFVLLSPDAEAAETARAAWGARVAVTDQSDAWATLVVSGPRTTSVLERTCRLDLHAEAFPPGHVARTSMDHLSVILVRESDERFTLLSPRSSAGSFVHALETSVRNVS